MKCQICSSKAASIGRHGLDEASDEVRWVSIGFFDENDWANERGDELPKPPPGIRFNQDKKLYETSLCEPCLVDIGVAVMENGLPDFKGDTELLKKVLRLTFTNGSLTEAEEERKLKAFLVFCRVWDKEWFEPGLESIEQVLGGKLKVDIEVESVKGHPHRFEVVPDIEFERE